MISRKLFTKSMHALIKQRDIDEECNKAFSVILPSDYVTYYDNFGLKDSMIDLILSNFAEGARDPLEYYIYELDFGDKYKEYFPIELITNECYSCLDKLYTYLITL